MSTARRRSDKYLAPQPVEVIRFFLVPALLQAREGDAIEIYLPPAAEHADQIVNQSKPLALTTITETSDEV